VESKAELDGQEKTRLRRDLFPGPFIPKDFTVVQNLKQEASR
jgi:hypothetical protein